MTNRDRLFADEAALPQQADICGAAVDLINSETSPVTGLSVATILIDAGKSSQSHYHRVMEEIYYFVSGRGRVTVGDELRCVAGRRRVHSGWQVSPGDQYKR